MNCQPRDGEGLGTLSGPCFVDRHAECASWSEEHQSALNIWGVRGCTCQLHVDDALAK